VIILALSGLPVPSNHVVASVMEESTTNTNMVANAAEEMTATIGQIAGNAEHAHTITEKAVTKAPNAVLED